MYQGRNENVAGQGGLIGKGISKITNGKLESIPDVRNKINEFLGIPQPLIPTVVADKIRSGMTLEQIEAQRNGTEFGKFLKQNARV